MHIYIRIYMHAVMCTLEAPLVVLHLVIVILRLLSPLVVSCDWPGSDDEKCDVKCFPGSAWPRP